MLQGQIKDWKVPSTAQINSFQQEDMRPLLLMKLTHLFEIIAKITQFLSYDKNKYTKSFNFKKVI